MVLKIKANAVYIRTLMEESDDLSVCQGTVRRIKERKKGKPMASILSVLLPSYTSFYQTKVGGIINLAFLMSSTDRAGMVFIYVDFIFSFKSSLGSSSSSPSSFFWDRHSTALFSGHRMEKRELRTQINFSPTCREGFNFSGSSF